MKILLTILFVFALIYNTFGEELYSILPSSIKLNPDNYFIRNSPTPYLQNKSIHERRIPENNYAKELEMDLIEIRTLQICA